MPNASGKVDVKKLTPKLMYNKFCMGFLSERSVV